MIARISPLIIVVALLIGPSAGLAGMLSPISSNPVKVYLLNDSPLLQTMTVGVY